ncbi:unnamed protein product [Caenorhabditis sp. 36 PRJEB53466]|nr:unnamed protein product [Caenorhabditis sp. 36 PRJEB53466]
MNAEERAEREANARRAIAVIAHANECTVAGCTYKDPIGKNNKCVTYKKVIKHMLTCPKKITKECPLCTSALVYHRYHSAHCEIDNCQYPYCMDTKLEFGETPDLKKALGNIQLIELIESIMGLLKYKDSSSSSDEEKVETEKERETENEYRKRLRTYSVDEEIKFGEQLQDDLINSFCDKLQAVSPRKIEALLAIQFLMFNDTEEIKKHVSGEKDAMQVLYDRTRSHYVLVHFDPKIRTIFLMDSLQPFGDGNPLVITEIANQIAHLFGHLFASTIPITVDKEFEHQSDNFSCGYRVIGALVDLARQRNPANYKYSRQAILHFLKMVLNEPNPTWQMFESAKFGVEKKYMGRSVVTMRMSNPAFSKSTSSSLASSRATSRASSRASSRPSSRESSTSSAKATGKRASAGGTVVLEMDEEMSCWSVEDVAMETAESEERTAMSPLGMSLSALGGEVLGWLHAIYAPWKPYFRRGHGKMNHFDE